MALIELTTFRLAAGVDEATFLALDERVQCEVFNHAPGALRRTLARGDRGAWLISTVSHQPVEVAGTDAGAALAACMDPASLRVERYTPR